MYHSVTFGDKNTYDDWHLVPESRPVIAMPPRKKVTVDIPGGQGLLDMSESLTHYPLYNQRTGSMKFRVLNGYRDWASLYEEIALYLHGQEMQMVLEDDPDWYYTGHYEIVWTSNNDGTGSVVDVNYELDPFKYHNTIDTLEFTNCGTSGVYLYPLDGVSSMPIIPWINITSIGGNAEPIVTVSVHNPELDINFNDNQHVMGGIVENNQLLYNTIISNMDSDENQHNQEDSLAIYVKTNASTIDGSIQYRRAIL